MCLYAILTNERLIISLPTYFTSALSTWLPYHPPTMTYSDVTLMDMRYYSYSCKFKTVSHQRITRGPKAKQLFPQSKMRHARPPRKRQSSIYINFPKPREILYYLHSSMDTNTCSHFITVLCPIFASSASILWMLLLVGVLNGGLRPFIRAELHWSGQKLLHPN